MGAAFAIDGFVVGLDVFDSQNIAREYLPKVIRSYALDAIAQRSSRATRAGVAASRKPLEVEVVELLDQVSNADAESFPAVGVGTDVRIDSRDLAGAALVRDDQVVHLSAFRKRITRRPGRRAEA